MVRFRNPLDFTVVLSVCQIESSQRFLLVRGVSFTVHDRRLASRYAPQCFGERLAKIVKSKAKRCLPPQKAFSFTLCVFLLTSVNVLIRSGSVNQNQLDLSDTASSLRSFFSSCVPD